LLIVVSGIEGVEAKLHAAGLARRAGPVARAS
jgi:hypothetical protein